VTETIGNALIRGQSLGLDRVDVQILLCTALQKPRTYLLAWPERMLTEPQKQLYQGWLARRLRGEPIAYIVGEREFWSLPLKTNASTLIPRPDTEILVETVLAHFGPAPTVCLDLGTGTGAIALALKSERPGWLISGIDRQPHAVELAQENAVTLGLTVEFRVGDWCADVAPGSVDLLVSNPPYIDADDPHLRLGDVRFEPAGALVAERGGLSEFEKIVEQASVCLTLGGALFFEHGWQQAAPVRAMLAVGGFSRVETVTDYGGNERVSLGYLEHQ
jgi:release factor glutamine methyltransferase